MAKLTNQFTGPGCKTILSVTKLTKIPAWESVGPGISNILKKSLGKHLCSKYEEHHSEIQINQNPKICTPNIVRGGVFVMQKELNDRQFTVPGIYQLKTPSIRIEETAFLTIHRICRSHIFHALNAGYTFIRTWLWVNIFLRFVFNELFPALGFPRSALGELFPTFDTGWAFSRAWHKVHFLPRLALGELFPALGIGCAFLQTRCKLYLFFSHLELRPG